MNPIFGMQLRRSNTIAVHLLQFSGGAEAEGGLRDHYEAASSQCWAKISDPDAQNDTGAASDMCNVLNCVLQLVPVRKSLSVASPSLMKLFDCYFPVKENVFFPTFFCGFTTGGRKRWFSDWKLQPWRAKGKLQPWRGLPGSPEIRERVKSDRATVVRFTLLRWELF